MRAENALPPVLAEFGSATAAATAALRMPRARRAVHFLSLMAVSALALAWLVPIDRVVTARGRVVAESPSIVVQPLETSIVRSIAVQEGQIVRKGNVLLTLDPTFSGADASQLEQKLASLSAEIARLEAELAGEPYVPVTGGTYEELQATLAKARQAERAATLERYDERIRSSEATLERYGRDVAIRRPQLDLLEEVEKMNETLEAKQAGSRLKTLAARNGRLEAERELAVGEATLREVRHGLAALRAERDAYQEQWRGEAARDLAQRRAEADHTREELAKAQKRRDLVDLRAVEDAVVLKLGNFSIGSVLRSAEPAVTLVPLGAPLQVEADIASIDQGYVKPGDPVVIKLDAYRYMRHGVIEGEIRSISGDAFTPSGPQGASGPPVYRAYIDMKAIKLHDVPAGFRPVPGMPLTADVVVGSSTLAASFVDRVLQPFQEGMREP
jgi:HlyD family type I secretion membrane fusion protein